MAWKQADYELALDGLQRLAAKLARSHPGAAASLNEGLAESLTLQLKCHEQLRRTLASTNPIESMIECVRRTSRNVKRRQSGDMCLRWTVAGMLEAESQSRKIIGVDHLARLTIAVKLESPPSAPPRPCPPPPSSRPLRSQPLTDH